MQLGGGLCADCRVSLVVTTLGRVETLRRLLESLRTQHWANFEVILADQSPAGTLEVLLAAFGDLNMRIKRIPAVGVSAARNAVLDWAEGEIIGFPDDDCHYEPDTLVRVVAFFQANPDVGGVFGRWRPGLDDRSPQPRDSCRPLTRYSVFRHGETYVQFYRREALVATGGFDPSLGPGSGLPYGGGEDTDFALRVLQAGFCLMRTNSVTVYHPAPNMISGLAMRSKMRAYGVGRMRLIAKHKFPLWFKLANVLFPLLALSLEGGRTFQYRRAMFRGRLAGFLHDVLRVPLKHE